MFNSFENAGEFGKCLAQLRLLRRLLVEFCGSFLIRFIFFGIYQELPEKDKETFILRFAESLVSFDVIICTWLDAVQAVVDVAEVDDYYQFSWFDTCCRYRRNLCRILLLRRNTFLCYSFRCRFCWTGQSWLWLAFATMFQLVWSATSITVSVVFMAQHCYCCWLYCYKLDSSSKWCDEIHTCWRFMDRCSPFRYRTKNQVLHCSCRGN